MISENPLGPLGGSRRFIWNSIFWKRSKHLKHMQCLFRGWSQQAIIIRKWYSMVFQYMYIILYYNLCIKFYIYFKLFVFFGCILQLCICIHTQTNPITSQSPISPYPASVMKDPFLPAIAWYSQSARKQAHGHTFVANGFLVGGSQPSWKIFVKMGIFPK